jgi:hypothetical protein
MAIVEEFERDPEARCVDEQDPSQVREKMLDKTDADSFPASDPPSTIPDPENDSFAPDYCFPEGSRAA